ncbi:hypothetical protein IP81_15840 [Novosphingobium sp. AAP83]|nr:hypothetical protein IP81_15840 [Novosphingobium sp. AAP83]
MIDRVAQFEPSIPQSLQSGLPLMEKPCAMFFRQTLQFALPKLAHTFFWTICFDKSLTLDLRLQHVGLQRIAEGNPG